jgi:hypothetical protein
MRRIFRGLAFLAALIAASPALAQSTILQGGPWTPGHLPQYVGQGFTQPIVQDGGTAGGGGLGATPNELGLTNRSPTNTYPAVNGGSGPGGTNFCTYDAPITNPTGFHYLCLGANSSITGGGILAYGAGGTASVLPFAFNINGVNYLPGGTSNTIYDGSTAISGGVPGTLLFNNNNVLGHSSFQASNVVTTLPLSLSSVVDNASAINAAITTTASAGGGLVRLPCGGPYYASQILLQSYVYVEGCGRDATILKQIAGSNEAFVTQTGIGSLWGTNSTGGTQWNGISHLTLDGNIANNTAGDCLQSYGRYQRWTDLKVTNCVGNGIRTEWSLTGIPGPPTNPSTTDIGLEGFFEDVHVWDAGLDGWLFNGPHDSSFVGVIIAGASEAATGTYDDLYIGPNGNGRFDALHVYASAITTFVAACGVDIQSSGSTFTNSNIEGAQIPLYIGNGTTCQNTSSGGSYFGQNFFDGSNEFYNATVGPTIVVRSPFNVIRGFVGTSYNAVQTVGVALGQGSDNAGTNTIDLGMDLNNGGAVDFTHDGAHNRVSVNAYQTTGPGYVGTPAADDIVAVDVHGSPTSLVSFHQNPFPSNGEYVGGANYGTAAALMACSSSTTQCYLSVANASGVGSDPSTWQITANGTGGGITFNVNSGNQFGVNNAGAQVKELLVTNPLLSNTAPTIASGFGTGATINSTNVNGSASFLLYVGTGGSATNGVLTMPSAPSGTVTHGWACHADDLTTQTSTVFVTKQTASTSTTVTLGNFNTSGAPAAWASADFLEVMCLAN